MHLLHERSICVDKPTGSQHTVNFVHHALRVEHMLKHRLYQDPVNSPIQQRDLMPIRDELALFTFVDIEGHNI